MKKLLATFAVMMLLSLAAAPFAAANPGGGLSGKVVETMDSAGYTYVLIENANGKAWIACPTVKVKLGQNVTFQPGMPMQNFRSKTLDRTFDVIYFSGGLAK